jgi:DNA-binding transcriptional regulator/RsmH inhibitor MraZ
MPPIPPCVAPCVPSPLAAIPVTDSSLALYVQFLYIFLITAGLANVFARNLAQQSLRNFFLYAAISAMFCAALILLPHSDLEIFMLSKEAIFVGTTAFTIWRLSSWVTEQLVYRWRLWRYRRAT